MKRSPDVTASESHARRCLRSAPTRLTLIVQDSLRPYEKGKLREMHLHELPWPRQVLRDMGAIPVRLRVTLSYFIEPNPTRRGWRQTLPIRVAPTQVRTPTSH